MRCGADKSQPRISVAPARERPLRFDYAVELSRVREFSGCTRCVTSSDVNIARPFCEPNCLDRAAHPELRTPDFRQRSEHLVEMGSHSTA